MLKSHNAWAVFVAILIAAFAAAGCGSSPSAPTTVDPVGTWVGTAGNSAGTSNVTLVLARASSGYQGTIRDDAGKIAQNTPVANVALSGTMLTFTFLMTDGIGVSVTAQINGDSMTGNYVDSQGERGTVTCARRR